MHNKYASNLFVDFAICSFVPPPQYKQNPEMFKQTARLWSHVYAGAPSSSPEYTRKIDKLCAMGFDKVSDQPLITVSYLHKSFMLYYGITRPLLIGDVI
jgi:hypothetical protein